MDGPPDVYSSQHYSRGEYKTRKQDGTDEPGAAFIFAESPVKTGFSPAHGFVALPGAGSKFTIRFDPKSSKYGQAKRWHDAHLFTFQRVENFRESDIGVKSF